MDNKFTQEEFDNHYKEFIMNPSKYQTMDLNFKMAMLMKGCSSEEFDSKIDSRGTPPEEYNQSSEEWVDNEDGDEQDDYSSKHKRHGGEYNDGGDDSNEY